MPEVFPRSRKGDMSNLKLQTSELKCCVQAFDPTVAKYWYKEGLGSEPIAKISGKKPASEEVSVSVEPSSSVMPRLNNEPCVLPLNPFAILARILCKRAVTVT
jgi:hypothetical protein